jgi:hypothetical protein
MLVLIHIIIAVSGLVASGLTYVAPSAVKLKLSYVLVALTFISGTYLVLASDSSIKSACLSGIVYLSAVMLLLSGAKKQIGE